MSEHQEAQQLKIDLSDETTDHFTQFVNFLYQPNWEPTCTETSDMIYLAEDYALGERLVAQSFQDIILRTFRKNIPNIQRWGISHAQLCALLKIACSSITEREHPRDDPMRDVILWLIMSRLTELQKTEEFMQVLTEHWELGTQLLMRAGNGNNQMPPDPFVAREKDALCQRRYNKGKKPMHTHG